MDKLLHEAGLPITLFADINRLDGFSLQELIQFLEQGQQRYLDFLNQELSFSDPYSFSANIPTTKTIIPNAKDEVERFLNSVIKKNVDRLNQKISFIHTAEKFMIYHYQEKNHFSYTEGGTTLKPSVREIALKK